jgi:hypothetical protein
MPVRKNIPEAIQVRERFIRSFEELRYRGLVKTKNEFCKTVGLSNSGNLVRMEKEQREPGVTNMLLLHKKYGVSLNWLMLGAGCFLEKENQ